MKLTDDEVAALYRRCDAEFDGEAHLSCGELRSLLDEIQAGRLALTAEDHKALRWIVMHLEMYVPSHESSQIAKFDAAFATLDKLTKGIRAGCTAADRQALEWAAAYVEEVYRRAALEAVINGESDPTRTNVDRVLALLARLAEEQS